MMDPGVNPVNTGGPSRFVCECDRCWRRWGRPWPLSEAPATLRTWLAFEVRVDATLAAEHGPASWTEAELLRDVAA